MSQSMRFVHDIPVRPRGRGTTRQARGPAPSGRVCAVKGCADPGEYRAPISPHRVEDYQWLCLNHVREHNTAWNFFRDMSADEVEHYIKGNVTGHRPTWNLGEKTARVRNSAFEHTRDPFRVFGAGPGFSQARRPETPSPYSRLQRDALEALDLDEGACLADVKARYKELVKRFHPDANGGDRSCEDRLKRVIRAYRTLRASNFA
jgi:hypothetical protein